MSTTNKKKAYYLPTILLGVIVAAIFLMAIFTYQVPATEKALVLTMGKITSEEGPGLHFRLPLPFQEIIKYDVRGRCFDGNIGRMEETTTKDEKQVVVGINVFYKIENLRQFKTAVSMSAAEDYLSSRMRTAKASVIGKYTYDELINTDPAKMKLEQMKLEILQEIQQDVLDRYGLKVYAVTFSSIGVPEKTATAIAVRMKQERETEASKKRDEGKTIAQQIRTAADLDKSQQITAAEAEARKIMAEGDAEAANYYKIYNQDPELAAFLRQLESLRKILKSKTTLMMDTSSAPFNVLNSKFMNSADASAAGNAK